MTVIFRPNAFVPTHTGSGFENNGASAWDNNPATYAECIASPGTSDGSSRLDYSWAADTLYTERKRYLFFDYRLFVNIISSAGVPSALATIEYSWDSGSIFTVLQQLVRSDTIGSETREQIDSIAIPLGTPLANIRARGYAAVNNASSSSQVLADTRLKEIWVEVRTAYAAQAFI